MKLKKIEAGHYLSSDGRHLIKKGSGWHILKGDGNVDFGPVPTLTAAKEYVSSGSIILNEHNMNSTYGKGQSKKEYNAYLAAEAKRGNFIPLLVTLITLFIFVLIATAIDPR